MNHQVGLVAIGAMAISFSVFGVTLIGACGQVATQVPVDAGGDVGVLAGKTYDGYLVGLATLSGSNRIRITLATADDGRVFGNVIFGDDPLLAPPSDPHVGYPAGWGGDGQQNLKGPIEHFPFSILQGLKQGSRVTFAIKTQQLWKSWCELQPTVYNAECLPPGTTNVCPDAGTDVCCLYPPDGGAVPMDCEYIRLCSWSGPCTCPPSGCTVDLTMNPDVSFDLQLSGDTLEGSIVGSGATIHATVAP